jgi:hypothetical protein
VDDKRVELEFVYDRLGEDRRSQAYFLLVPETLRRIRTREEELKRRDASPDGGALRPSLLPTPRRAGDHR